MSEYIVDIEGGDDMDADALELANFPSTVYWSGNEDAPLRVLPIKSYKGVTLGPQRDKFIDTVVYQVKYFVMSDIESNLKNQVLCYLEKGGIIRADICLLYDGRIQD